MTEEANVKVEKESAERIKKHAETYKTPKKMNVSVKSHITSKGDTKEKFIRSKTYSNGVVKNEICGLKKNNKWIFGTDK